MLGFRQFLVEEAQRVRTVGVVRQIITDYRNNPIYVAFGGTFGAGKTTYANEHFRDLVHVIDFDDIAMEMVGGSENIEMIKTVAKDAIKVKEMRVNGMFSSNKSFVDMGTMKDYDRVSNRLEQAKKAGYKTMLVFISTDPEEAMRRNLKRLAAGKRGVQPEKVHAFYNAYYDAVHTFNALKRSDLVDFYHEVQT